MDTSKKTKHSFGGLKINNQDQISYTLFCELCKLLLFKPTQILCCGARLCQWCSKRGLSNSEPFICPFCHIEQPKKQVLMDRGIERELNMIKVDCYSCSWNGSYKDYQTHLQEQHADFECNDCHTRFFTINSFEEHRQEICECRSGPCGVPGCNESVKIVDMKYHYLCITHQKLLIKCVIDYIIQNEHLFYKSKHLKTKSSFYHDITQEMKAVQASMDMVSPGLITLSDDCIRLRSEYNQLKSNCEGAIIQVNETKTKFNEDNEILLKCIQSQDDTFKEMEESKTLYLSTKILILDDNGSMIFSFNRHRDEINSPFTINSPKFKTSPHGYLFILRVCSTLNSTDENQGYLSVYITLLRGDFDPVLFYPFPYNIFLYLYDQSGKGKHIVSTIVPDPTSSSFARPISEKNDEIGIIKFCRLSCLTDAQSLYLKDNVFFIRIFIDFMNTGSAPIP